VAQLRESFFKNGYVRFQNPERLETEGWSEYKKGDEVRLVADSVRDLRHLERLLRAVGLKPGRPFKKARQYRLPLYGREQVAEFLELVGAEVVG
jgi:hypothetical protein